MIKEKVDMSTMTRDDLYAEFLKSKLRESEEDIKNGRFMSIEESKERMRKKYEGLNI